MIIITALLFSTFVYENYSREWSEMTRRGTNPGQNMKIWKYPIIIHINKSIDTTHILPDMFYIAPVWEYTIFFSLINNMQGFKKGCLSGQNLGFKKGCLSGHNQGFKRGRLSGHNQPGFMG